MAATAKHGHLRGEECSRGPNAYLGKVAARGSCEERTTAANAPAAQPKPRASQAPLTGERKKVGIIGTGTSSTIDVIKTKLVNIFATKFSPDLEADTPGAMASWDVCPSLL